MDVYRHVHRPICSDVYIQSYRYVYRYVCRDKGQERERGG